MAREHVLTNEMLAKMVQSLEKHLHTGASPLVTTPPSCEEAKKSVSDNERHEVQSALPLQPRATPA